VVSVDGVEETVTGTETVNGLRIKVKDAFYSDSLDERSATLVIGEDTTKTYNDGDAYIGEDEDDPDWVWDLGGLNETTKSNIKLGIQYDQTLDDPSDNPPIVGEQLCLPNDYICIKLDHYTVTDYQKYVFETTTGEELYSSDGSTQLVTSAKTIHIHSEGANWDGLKTASGSHETDDIYLWYNSSSKDTMVFWKDHDSGNKLKYAGTTLANGTSSATTLFTIEYSDTSIAVTGVSNASGTNVNLTIDEGATDLQIYFETHNNAFEYLGHSDGDTTTANDILYGTKDISGWEEDTRTQKGIIVYAPDKSASSDKLEIDVPADIDDFAVDVIITGPETTITTSGGEGAVSLGGVPVEARY